MEREGEEVHIDSDDARGGSTPHVVRYVLLFSTLLAAVALTITWVSAAMMSSN